MKKYINNIRKYYQKNKKNFFFIVVNYQILLIVKYKYIYIYRERERESFNYLLNNYFKVKLFVCLFYHSLTKSNIQLSNIYFE